MKSMAGILFVIAVLHLEERDGQATCLSLAGVAAGPNHRVNGLVVSTLEVENGQGTGSDCGLIRRRVGKKRCLANDAYFPS